MTPDEWQTCSDPQAMLNWLHSQKRLSDRKARLYAVAVCKRILPRLTDERSRRAVEVVERFADGLADRRDLVAARDEAREARRSFIIPEQRNAWHAASAAMDATRDTGSSAAMNAMNAASQALSATHGWDTAGMVERSQQAVLLRDIVHPFHTASFDAAWRTAAVLSLAQTIYVERQFDRMPTLAALLEAAGAADAELLSHLKSGGPHAGRGCWGLDVVLGKQ
jgi:hypothetical protein